MANLPLAFAEVLVGAIVLDAGVKGDSLTNVVLGKATQHPLVDQGSSTGGSTPSSTGGGSTPFGPGATSSRLDAGQDVTSSTFRAPAAGTIIRAEQTNSGWQGGGYMALKLDQPIALADGTLLRALYFAEGIAPFGSVGQHLSAGDTLAKPVSNPYNGVVGNIEWGPADPSSGEPLAHQVSNPAAMVRAFYKWALSIGAPSAHDFSVAGFH